eukprot:Skav222561  [mRNA]  locus=scaffold791:99692:103924:+ [translate_table: standard]
MTGKAKGPLALLTAVSLAESTQLPGVLTALPTEELLDIDCSTDAKKLACQCIQAIRDNRVPEGHVARAGSLGIARADPLPGAYNATTVHVLPDWLDNWSGCRALEDELLDSML